jgi:glutamyl-tRNA synthetase
MAGTFILRIHDSNQALSDQRYTDIVYDAMSWLGLDYDRTFRQNDRLPRYRQVADDLLRAGKASSPEPGCTSELVTS